MADLSKLTPSEKSALRWLLTEKSDTTNPFLRGLYRQVVDNAALPVEYLLSEKQWAALLRTYATHEEARLKREALDAKIASLRAGEGQGEASETLLDSLAPSGPPQKTGIGAVSRYRMAELYRNGWSQGQIAREYGVSISTVRYHLMKEGVLK